MKLISIIITLVALHAVLCLPLWRTEQSQKTALSAIGWEILAITHSKLFHLSISLQHTQAAKLVCSPYCGPIYRFHVTNRHSHFQEASYVPERRWSFFIDPLPLSFITLFWCYVPALSSISHHFKTLANDLRMENIRNCWITRNVRKKRTFCCLIKWFRCCLLHI